MSIAEYIVVDPVNPFAAMTKVSGVPFIFVPKTESSPSSSTPPVPAATAALPLLTKLEATA